MVLVEGSDLFLHSMTPFREFVCLGERCGFNLRRLLRRGCGVKRKGNFGLIDVILRYGNHIGRLNI